MPAQQALNSPFGNSPDDLGKTQTSGGAFDDLMADAAESITEAPQEAQVQPQQEGLPQEDPFIEDGSPVPQGTPTPGGPAPEGFFDDIIAEEATEVEDTASFTEQAKERFKLSFAGNNKEKLLYMQNKLGEDNARLKGGALEIRRPGSKKFVKFDKDAFDATEIVMDILDFGRDVVEEAAATGVAIKAGAETAALGAAGGTVVAPGPGTLAGALGGGIAGIAAGRAVGGAVGFGAAEAVARAFDIPFDESRNIPKEAIASAAIQSVFGAAGDTVGAALRKFKTARLTPTHETILPHNMDVLKSARELRDKGIIENIPGTNTPIRFDQIHPDSDIAKSGTKAIASIDDELGRKFLKADIQQGRLLTEAIENHANTIANVTNRKVDGKDISRLLKNVTEDVFELEGKAIGGFKEAAIKKLGTQKMLPGESLQRPLQEMLESVGYQGAKAPALDDFMLAAGIDSPNQAKAMIKQIDSLVDNATTKGFGVKEIDELTKLWSRNLKSVNKMSGLSRNYKKTLMGLRQTKNDMIQSGLTPDMAGSFMTANKKYSDMLKAHDMMKLAVGEDVTHTALIKHITTQGKAGLERLKGVKLLLKDNPEALANFKGAYIENVLMGNKKHFGKTVPYDITAIKKTFNKLDPRIQKEFFELPNGKNGYPQFKQLLEVAERVQQTNIRGQISDGAVKDVKHLVAGIASTVAPSSIAYKVNSIFALLSMGGQTRTNVFEKILTEEGIDGLLSGVSIKQKGVMRKALEGAISYGKTFGEPAARSGLRELRERDNFPELNAL
jgi:hypothetical protein